MGLFWNFGVFWLNDKLLIMKKVLVYRGLPASGKSTAARKMLDENPGKYKRINKDDLRAMLDNSHFSRGNEKFVLKLM